MLGNTEDILPTGVKLACTGLGIDDSGETPSSVKGSCGEAIDDRHVTMGQLPMLAVTYM